MATTFQEVRYTFLDLNGVMDGSSSENVTELLLAWGNGDKEALDKLIPLIHHEMYHLAARQMKGELHCVHIR